MYTVYTSHSTNLSPKALELRHAERLCSVLGHCCTAEPVESC